MHCGLDVCQGFRGIQGSIGLLAMKHGRLRYCCTPIKPPPISNFQRLKTPSTPCSHRSVRCVLVPPLAHSLNWLLEPHMIDTPVPTKKKNITRYIQCKTGIERKGSPRREHPWPDQVDRFDCACARPGLCCICCGFCGVALLLGGRPFIPGLPACCGCRCWLISRCC